MRHYVGASHRDSSLWVQKYHGGKPSFQTVSGFHGSDHKGHFHGQPVHQRGRRTSTLGHIWPCSKPDISDGMGSWGGMKGVGSSRDIRQSGWRARSCDSVRKRLMRLMLVTDELTDSG